MIKEDWKETLANIPGSPEFISSEPLTGGGSGRSFYRVKASDKSYVLLESEKPEEIYEYISISRFYRAHGVTVPDLISESKDGRIAAFFDAGDMDLYTAALSMLNSKNYSGVVELYKSAIEELVEIQNISAADAPLFVKSRKFDFEHYRWETDYFREKCCGDYFGIDAINDEEITRELDALAESLISEPEFIVHRDFQSQNIYIKENRSYIIDFQSARIGSCFYDAASLLKDPYVELPDSIHDELFKYYIKRQSEERVREYVSIEEAHKIYDRAALQRIMQALGAYGNLGLTKKKDKFLKYIPPAIRILSGIIKDVEDMPALKELVFKLESRI